MNATLASPPPTPPCCPKRPAEPAIDLMLRVQRDEAGAFAELVRLYWCRVFGLFVRRLHDRQEAEDLTQEVFLRLFRARRRYQPRARFTTWLFHIARNVARNAYRRRQRRSFVPLEYLREDQENPGHHQYLLEDSESPSQPLERQELAGVVRAAVRDLGGRQSQALELHQFHSEDRRC